EQLTAAGVDEVVVVDFTTAVSEQSPEEFVREFVHQRARANAVVVGDNFRFGHRALGDVHTLEELGGTYDFSVHDVDLRGDVQTYSSTRAREALLGGDLATVTQVLGRPFSYRGVVVHGDHRGRTLGVPTANVTIAADRAAPGDGVYAGRVRRPGTHGPPVTAAISVGSNPQYAGTERRIEAHVLDEEDLDLYDAEIDVEFHTRLRGQQVFDSEAAFIEQMQADIRAARAIGEAPEAS
ncbi:MAG: riboflavin kinase, partial [Actinomycetota bacterium]